MTSANPSTYNTENSQYSSQYIMPGSPHSGMSSAGGSGVAGIQMLKTHSDKIDPTATAATPVTITYWYDPTQEEIFYDPKTREQSHGPGGPYV